MGELKQRKKDAPKSDKKPSADQKEKSKESAAAQSPPANAKSKKEPAKKQREPKPAEQRDESDEDSDVPGDSYGYAGSDDEDDAGDLEDGPSIADKDDDYDESQRPFVVPAHLANVEETDDTMLLVAGLVGFFLCMLCAAVLPTWGVPAEWLMIGGMGSLLGYIIVQNFMPSCSRDGSAKVSSSPMDAITPYSVFVVTGCIGTMLGGMFGGVLKNIQWDKM